MATSDNEVYETGYPLVNIQKAIEAMAQSK